MYRFSPSGARNQVVRRTDRGLSRERRESHRIESVIPNLQSGSFPFANKHSPEEVQRGLFLAIAKLTSVQVHTVADLAGLKPNVWLPRIDHPNHGSVANGTTKAINEILFLSKSAIANINFLGTPESF